MLDPDTIPLTALTRELAAITGAEKVPTYRQLWNMVVDGRLTAVQQVGRAYQIRRADLPVIAAQLGLMSRTQKSPRGNRKSDSAQTAAA